MRKAKAGFIAYGVMLLAVVISIILAASRAGNDTGANNPCEAAVEYADASDVVGVSGMSAEGAPSKAIVFTWDDRMIRCETTAK